MSEKDFDVKITTSWFDKDKFKEFEICYCKTLEIANSVRNLIKTNLNLENGFELNLIGSLNVKKA